MNKILTKIQKISYFLALLSVVLLFAYSLVCGTAAAGTRFGDDAETYFVNFQVLYYAIAGFICFGALAVFDTGKRKKYYLSNGIVIGIFAVYSIVTAILLVPNIQYFSAEYMNLLETGYFENLYYTLFKAWYLTDTFLIDIGYLPMVMLLATSVMLLFVAAYKYLNQRKEKKEVE